MPWIPYLLMTDCYYCSIRFIQWGRRIFSLQTKRRKGGGSALIYGEKIYFNSLFSIRRIDLGNFSGMNWKLLSEVIVLVDLLKTPLKNEVYLKTNFGSKNIDVYSLFFKQKNTISRTLMYIIINVYWNEMLNQLYTVLYCFKLMYCKLK